MRARSKVFIAFLFAGLGAACESEAVEEYPTGDEVPVTEPAAATPSPGLVGVDTVLDPVVPPPPGTTPP